ncbi:hypothetical protein BH23GEM11_BH23GEM11_18070 [soil metagenome]
MRHCLFCDHALGAGVPEAPAPGRRHAYDPGKGRLWEICPSCRRWNPVPMELRWETLEGWERAVRDRGTLLVEAGELSLVEVDDGQVVRVGAPPLTTWGGWRYGSRLPPPAAPKVGFLRRILGGLPPPPLEGYDPYGLSGPMGGVAGTQGPSHWLGSPFLERAHPLTLVFASVPLVPSCPSCGVPMPLAPWDFHRLSFTDATPDGEAGAGRGAGVEAAADLRAGLLATCGHCSTEVVVAVDQARPALRIGLSVLDSGPEARKVGEEAGAALDRVGGTRMLLKGLASVGAPLGDLGRVERVALGIALDARAEADALVAEWRDAEEITAIMDSDLTDVAGFMAFRERVLGEGTPG